MTPENPGHDRKEPCSGSSTNEKPEHVSPISWQSSHLARWICYGGYVDVDALLKEAQSSSDSQNSVKEQLSDLLFDRFDEWEVECIGSNFGGRYLSIEEVAWDENYTENSGGEYDLDDLFASLLASAWSMVNPDDVARAILVHKGIAPDQP